MATKYDSRQVVSRDTLDQLSLAAGQQVDNLLISLNKELIAPLRMTVTGANRVLSIGAIAPLNTQTNRTRVSAPINGAIPSFTSGAITFPSASNNPITINPGSNTTLPTMAAGNFIKALVQVNGAGNLSLKFGTPGASLVAATLPEYDSEVSVVGYVVVRDVAGAIQNILVTDLYSFPTIKHSDNSTPLDTFTLNDNAAGSGADWKAIFQRPTSGMTANATHTLPSLTGTIATLASISQTFAGATTFTQGVSIASVGSLTSGATPNRLVLAATTGNRVRFSTDGGTTEHGSIIAGLWTLGVSGESGTHTVNGGLTITGTLTAGSFTSSGSTSSGDILLASGTYKFDVVATVGTDTLNIGTANADIINFGTASSTQTINIGTGSGVTTINIGGSGDTVTIGGTLTYINTTDLTVTDTTITLNKGGTSGSAGGAGVDVEEGGSITGYFKQDSSTRTSWQMKATGSAGVITFVPGASGFSINQGLSTTSSPTFASLNVTGARTVGTTSVTSASYAVLATDYLLLCNPTTAGANIVPTLPAASAGKRVLIIKDISGVAQNANRNIVVTAAGADLIDGAATFRIEYNYGAFTFISDGTSKWSVI